MARHAACPRADGTSRDGSGSAAGAAGDAGGEDAGGVAVVDVADGDARRGRVQHRHAARRGRRTRWAGRSRSAPPPPGRRSSRRSSWPARRPGRRRRRGSRRRRAACRRRAGARIRLPPTSSTRTTSVPVTRATNAASAATGVSPPPAHEHADPAHRLGHRADGGGHRGGVHGRVRVVLAGQRDERLGGGAQHQRRAVGVLAAGLAHQGEDLLGAAAGAPDDVGLDGARRAARPATRRRPRRGTGPSSGSAALPVPSGGSRAGQERSETAGRRCRRPAGKAARPRQ